jgi:uncharacterized membrane protein
MADAPAQLPSDLPPPIPLGPGSPANPSPTDMVTVPELCRACGYSLRGLPVLGKCPECGKSVQSSLRGDLLIFASLEYLDQLRRGATVIVVGLWFTVIAILASIAASYALPDTGPWISTSFTTLAVLVNLAGWWLFSAPDPGKLKDKGDRPRRILRVALLISSAGSILAAVADLLLPNAFATLMTGITAPPGTTGTPGTPVAGGGPAGPTASPLAQALSLAGTVIGSAASIVQFFASMKYLSWLAPRIPDAELFRKSKQYMWLLPLIYLVLCGIGMIVTWIMVIILFVNLRRQLTAIRADAVLAEAVEAETGKILPPPVGPA